MEYLPNGFTLTICDGGFPLSTDSMVLSHFVRLPRRAQVLDLGSGCGTLGLLLCAAHADCHVSGIELDPCAHHCAQKNIRENRLDHRMKSICADLRQIPQTYAPGAFSCCISNPPYFSGGAASSGLAHARQETTCTLADLIHCASWALKYGGDFFLVHKPERLAEIIVLAATAQLEAKRLLLLRHREDGPVCLILLQLRKGGKPGLQIEENALFHANGEPTIFYKNVYHI